MKTSCCHSKKIHVEKDYCICRNETCSNFMLQTKAFDYSKTRNIIFSFCFFIFFFILTFNDFSYNANVSKEGFLKNFSAASLPLTTTSLQEEIQANKLICQDEVYAQIMIESGYLTSYLLKRANNLLGMRYPFKRKTCASGLYLPESNTIIKGSQQELKKYRSQNNYAVYDNWQACIKDYKMWQDHSFKLTEKYLIFLGTYYAEDTLYVQKIKKLSK